MSKETNPQIPIPAWFTDWLSDKKSDNGSEGGIVENSHGWGIALAVYRHLSPTGESAGRWVRASERLPEAERKIFFEISYPKGRTVKCSGFLMAMYDGNNFVAQSLSYSMREYGERIKWLDEAQPTPTKPTEGQ